MFPSRLALLLPIAALAAACGASAPLNQPHEPPEWPLPDRDPGAPHGEVPAPVEATTTDQVPAAEPEAADPADEPTVPSTEDPDAAAPPAPTEPADEAAPPSEDP